MTIFRSTLLVCIALLLTVAAIVFYKFSTSQIIIPHQDGFFIFDRKNETITFCNKIACQQVPGLLYGIEGKMPTAYGPSKFSASPEPAAQTTPSYQANPPFAQAQTAISEKAARRKAEQSMRENVEKHLEEESKRKAAEEDTTTSDDAAADTTDTGPSDEETSNTNSDADTKDEEPNADE